MTAWQAQSHAPHSARERYASPTCVQLTGNGWGQEKQGGNKEQMGSLPALSHPVCVFSRQPGSQGGLGLESREKESWV